MLHVNIVMVTVYLSVDLFLLLSLPLPNKLFFSVFVCCCFLSLHQMAEHAIVTSNKFTVKAIIQLFVFGSFVITLSASVKMSSSQNTNQQQQQLCVYVVPQPFK